MTTMTPNAHERAEWARMAQDAYKHGHTFYGHRYSAQAALGGPRPVDVYDTLQRVYRQWLVFGWSAIVD
jgi:hypothetical protein